MHETVRKNRQQLNVQSTIPINVHTTVAIALMRVFPKAIVLTTKCHFDVKRK